MAQATQPSWLSDVMLRSDSPLSEQIYTHLRDLIVTGRVPPGMALHEPSLAQQVGTSRTPVREALLRLRDDGLIDIKRQSGTFVAAIDANRVEEGMMVREALEPRLAEMAASNITDRILADLTFETDQMAKAVENSDSRSFIAADDRFHRMLVDASGFVHVAAIIQRVNAQLDRIRYLSASEPVRAQSALNEHRTIIDYLRAGDATGTAEMMQQHLTGSWALIRALLERQDEMLL
ncbi:MAG: GntR family transcriptional regulator [Geminicoccaceae bacterium]